MKQGKQQLVIKVLIIFTMLLQPVVTAAQNLTGIWEGVFRTDIAPNRSRSFFLHMELLHNGNRVQAVFFNALPETPAKPGVMYHITGRFPNQKSQWPLTLYRNRIIQDNLPEGVADAFAAFSASYLKNDTAELLFGTWQANIPSPRPDGAGGIFWARRVDTSISDYAARNMDARMPQTPPPPAAIYTNPLQKRKDVVADTVLIADSMVTLALMDDALTDNDTISLYVNGANISGPVALTAKPWQFTLPLEKNETYKLLLFAHNPGTIPPNTALLRLRWKNQARELTLAGDGDTNAVILLQRSN